MKSSAFVRRLSFLTVCVAIVSASPRPSTPSNSRRCTVSGGNDGANPHGGVTLVGSTIFGITEYGGAGGSGTIFSYNLSSGTEDVLHNFGTATDGSSPEGGLTLAGSAVYGTTIAGGVNQLGTIFSYTLTTGSENILHSFGTGSDGSGPWPGLTLVGSTLYGTTQYGALTIVRVAAV